MSVTKMKVRPLGDKVLVKRIEAEAMTAGGIILPETAKEKPKRGRVQAVGDGKLLDTGERAALTVKKGDEVLFSSYAGTEVKINNEEFLILDESDILATIE
jgi:chaperonin GroES